MKVFGKASAVIVMAALLSAGGCRKTPTVAAPAPGTAVLALTVVAEPKDGAPAVDATTYVAAVMQPVDYSSLDNIVVWLEPATASGNRTNDPPITFETDPPKDRSDLNGVVAAGQTVVIHNHGSAAANFYSVSDGNEFDLGEIAPSGTGSFTVASSGMIEVLSSTNRDPVIRLFVAPSRLVRMTKSGQQIEFRDLAPGQYKVVSWHPRLPGHEMEIDLPADHVAQATVKVGVNGLPQISPN